MDKDMGFEIKYSYHLRDEKGKYNTNETLENLVRIGKNTDETVPLDKVAASITRYLSRRDIWVVHVEVSEYAKRQVNFKECKDGRGFTLKNKKFLFGASGEFVENDINEENDVEPQITHTSIHNTNNYNQKEFNENNSVLIDGRIRTIDDSKIIEKVTFDTYSTSVPALYGLTLQKVYNVLYKFHKLKSGFIVIRNDNNVLKIVPDEYFVSVGVNEPEQSTSDLGQPVLRNNYSSDNSVILRR